MCADEIQSYSIGNLPVTSASCSELKPEKVHGNVTDVWVHGCLV